MAPGWNVEAERRPGAEGTDQWIPEVPGPVQSSIPGICT